MIEGWTWKQCCREVNLADDYDIWTSSNGHIIDSWIRASLPWSLRLSKYTGTPHTGIDLGTGAQHYTQNSHGPARIARNVSSVCHSSPSSFIITDLQPEASRTSVPSPMSSLSAPLTVLRPPASAVIIPSSIPTLLEARRSVPVPSVPATRQAFDFRLMQIIMSPARRVYSSPTGGRRATLIRLSTFQIAST